jgi:hypothetical protein
MKRNVLILSILICLLIAGCGINSVTKQELEAVKAGDILVYRYQKDGKSWFYADRVTRVEGDKIFFNPGKKEATAGNDHRLNDFVTDRELSMTKEELLKYETEQGDERKVIIWIK